MLDLEQDSKASFHPKLTRKYPFCQGLVWICLSLSFFVSLPFGFFCLFLKFLHSELLVSAYFSKCNARQKTSCKFQENEQLSSHNELMEWMLLELKQTQHSLQNKTFAAQVEHISMMSGQLFARHLLDGTQRNNQEPLMEFLRFYLSLTFHTTRAYCILERTPEPDSTLSQLEVIMDLLVGAFEQQCDQLHSNFSVDFSKNKQTLQALVNSCSVPCLLP